MEKQILYSFKKKLRGYNCIYTYHSVIFEVSQHLCMFIVCEKAPKKKSEKIVDRPSKCCLFFFPSIHHYLFFKHWTLMGGEELSQQLTMSYVTFYLNKFLLYIKMKHEV